MSGVPASNLWGTSLNVVWRRLHGADHLAAAHEGRHRLEQLPARPERTGAGGPEHLVARERVEVGADRLHVDRHVRHGLGAVDEDERAGRVRLLAPSRAPG